MYGWKINWEETESSESGVKSVKKSRNDLGHADKNAIVSELQNKRNVTRIETIFTETYVRANPNHWIMQ